MNDFKMELAKQIEELPEEEQKLVLDVIRLYKLDCSKYEEEIDEAIATHDTEVIRAVIEKYSELLK